MWPVRWPRIAVGAWDRYDEKGDRRWSALGSVQTKQMKHGTIYFVHLEGRREKSSQCIRERNIYTINSIYTKHIQMLVAAYIGAQPVRMWKKKERETACRRCWIAFCNVQNQSASNTHPNNLRWFIGEGF